MVCFLGAAVTAAATALFLPGANAQAGPNTLAQYNPANRTMSVNATYCILPISRADAQAITGFPPLRVPADILPGFPAGMHPLIATAGYNNDIRMTALNAVPLQIRALMQGAVAVPYMDVTRDGRTPILVNANAYIGGTNGQDSQALVPTIASAVSPFEGSTIFPARFEPDTQAALSLGGGVYSAQVKPVLVPNQVSGPGVYAEAIDFLFRVTGNRGPYAARTFHAMINQPRLLNNGQCQRNPTYFNETFTNAQFAVGNVTLYHQILATPPAAIEGQYPNVNCYQANGVQVAGLAEPCPVAAANNDPTALE